MTGWFLTNYVIHISENLEKDTWWVNFHNKVQTFKLISFVRNLMTVIL